MKVLLLFLLPAILLTASCDGGVEEPNDEASPTTTPPTTPASPTPTPTDDAELPTRWGRCSDDEDGYTIGYPDEWQVDAPEMDDRCRLFNPEPFEVRRGTEHPATAMMVRVSQRTFQQARSDFTDSPHHRMISRTETEVDGRDALRFEREQTETLLYPEGTKEYGYLIDHRGRAMLVTTLEIPGRDENYQENRELLDQAVETLELENQRA